MVEFVPFGSEHVGTAAGLVAARAHSIGAQEPLLRPNLEDADVARRLEGLADHGLGVAAVDGKSVLGFLAAFGVRFWGAAVAYVPEWGHVATDPDMVRMLYGRASERWLAEDRAVHTVTLWARDRDGEAAWHDLGFGRVVVDTLHDVPPPEPSTHRVDVRRAMPDDAAVVAEMERSLWEHLAAPPVFRVHPRPGGEAAAATRLGEPNRPVWLALDGSSPVGFLSFEPHGDETLALAGADVVRCDGAFVVPSARRHGTGAALFGAALAWAADAGFARCAVDFESANREASRFWPSMGCRPILHAVARRIGRAEVD